MFCLPFCRVRTLEEWNGRSLGCRIDDGRPAWVLKLVDVGRCFRAYRGVLIDPPLHGRAVSSLGRSHSSKTATTACAWALRGQGGQGPSTAQAYLKYRVETARLHRLKVESAPGVTTCSRPTAPIPWAGCDGEPITRRPWLIASRAALSSPCRRYHGFQYEEEEGEEEGLPETQAKGREGQGQAGQLHRHQLQVQR